MANSSMKQRLDTTATAEIDTAVLAPLPPGDWTRRHAAHLLRRAAFAATADELDRAVADGMQSTLDRLFLPQPESGSFDEESAVLRNAAQASENVADLKMWWLHRMFRSANPLLEKATLFWHNHFATSFVKVRAVDAMMAQNELFRQHALGAFGDLLGGIAKDAAMLLWLDGNANKKRQPNENFARELFELFALGVGNYTEADVQQAARAFSGWHVRNRVFWFDASQHDDAMKSVFGQRGNFDGNDIVKLCLQHEACPRLLAFKLLTWFATPNPPGDWVAALAARLRRDGLNIGKTLRALLASRRFYDARKNGTIKSPVDFVVGTLRALEVRGDNGLGTGPNLPPCAFLLSDLGQSLFEPPTVKGWEGGRNWLNSASYLKRVQFAAQVASGQPFGKVNLDALVAATIGQDPVQLLAERLLDGAASSALRKQLSEHFRATALDKAGAMAEGVYLVLASPEYQLG